MRSLTTYVSINAEFYTQITQAIINCFVRVPTGL